MRGRAFAISRHLSYFFFSRFRLDNEQALVSLVKKAHIPDISVAVHDETITRFNVVLRQFETPSKPHFISIGFTPFSLQVQHDFVSTFCLLGDSGLLQPVLVILIQVADGDGRCLLVVDHHFFVDALVYGVIRIAV